MTLGRDREDFNLLTMIVWREHPSLSSAFCEKAGHTYPSASWIWWAWAGLVAMFGVYCSLLEAAWAKEDGRTDHASQGYTRGLLGPWNGVFVVSHYNCHIFSESKLYKCKVAFASVFYLPNVPSHHALISS